MDKWNKKLINYRVRKEGIINYLHPCIENISKCFIIDNVSELHFHHFYSRKVDCLQVTLSATHVPAALTYHYETQCIPTPLAWFAHQLPVWWQKLSVVGTFVIEIMVPPLFFSPLRRLRLGAFYMQVGKIFTRSLLLFPY